MSSSSIEEEPIIIEKLDDSISSIVFDPLDASEHTDATVETDSSSELLDDDLIYESNMKRRQINFSSIQIREYERVVGDHPDTRIGVPISLGWKFIEQPAVDITLYEADRLPKKINLRMSSITRKNLLQTIFDISEEEIQEATIEVQKIKKQRQQSQKQSKVGAKTESAMKSFRKKMKRAISFEKIIEGLAYAASNSPSSAASSMMMPISSY